MPMVHPRYMTSQEDRQDFTGLINTLRLHRRSTTERHEQDLRSSTPSACIVESYDMDHPGRCGHGQLT